MTDIQGNQVTVTLKSLAVKCVSLLCALVASYHLSKMDTENQKRFPIGSKPAWETLGRYTSLPNRCGDSPKNKPCNLEQMWVQLKI